MCHSNNDQDDIKRNKRHEYIMKPCVKNALLAVSIFSFSTFPSLAQIDHLAIVKQYTDNVLNKASDKRFHSPLLANGINVTSSEQLTWRFPDGQEAILSNFSAQQNFLRLLVGLSEITGDPKYKQQAADMVNYYFDHFQHPNGLLYWGGHRFIDLNTLQPVGPSEKERVHELKNAYPWYDFMFTVNEKGTAKFIKAFWNAHIYDWKTLETSRHGQYEKKPHSVWTESFTQQQPFISTKGLSFLNAGNDLIYSALSYAKNEQDSSALLWGKRLAEQYILARNPITHLGVYQFTQPLKRDTTRDDSNTLSKFGDRAARQFGPEFGEAALEGNVLIKEKTHTLYSENALMQLHIAKSLGQEGQVLLTETLDGMAAFAHYAYQPTTNTFKPLLADGTDLSNYELPRDGYYGKRGKVLMPYKVDNDFMLSYTRAYLIEPRPEFWMIVTGIANHLKLGDLGSEPGKNVHINANTHNADPYVLFSLIDLYQATHNQDYLTLADKIADNIINQRYINQLFVNNAKRQFANIDAIEPFAILTLEAAKHGKIESLPVFINGHGFTEGAYLMSDGKSRVSTRDSELFSLNKGEILKPNGKK